MQERHINRDRYFEEQAQTTRKYYIPYIKRIVGDLPEKVLEVGCGEGGNLLPFAAVSYTHLDVYKRQLQFFQHHNSCSFSHHKAVSFFIKRNGGSVRIFTGRQGGQRGKTGYSNGADAGFSTSRHHHVRFPILNGTERLSDGMCASGAGGYHVDTFSFQAELDGNVSRRHIADHQRNQKGVHPARAL